MHKSKTLPTILRRISIVCTKVEIAHSEIASKVLRSIIPIMTNWQFGKRTKRKNRPTNQFIYLVFPFETFFHPYLGSRKDWHGYTSEECAPTRARTSMETIASDACTRTTNATNAIDA